MGTGKHSIMCRTLNDLIGFTKWARLTDETVSKLFFDAKNIKHVFVGPDVQSLHIVWQWRDGEIEHEIADYDDDKSIEEFLSDEIGDDAWEQIEWTTDVYEAIMDFGNTRDSIKEITLEQLQETFCR